MSGDSDCYDNDFIQQALVATTTGQQTKPKMPTQLLQIWASFQLTRVSIWMILALISILIWILLDIIHNVLVLTISVYLTEEIHYNCMALIEATNIHQITPHWWRNSKIDHL